VATAAEAAKTGDRRSTLEAMRDKLARDFDDAPPADWASEDIDDDPGWELGNLVEGVRSSSPPAGSFDAALKAVATRPTFAPRAPATHPQMATLRGTGGLDLEPPGGKARLDRIPKSGYARGHARYLLHLGGCLGSLRRQQSRGHARREAA
jgi:hypothetical protein